MQRHDRMTAAGIKVLHFTPSRIRAQPDQIVATIAATLRTGSPIAGLRTVPLA
jgi:very-short-patch-repair endonuclease